MTDFRLRLIIAKANPQKALRSVVFEKSGGNGAALPERG
jgi:hypothetical protein